MLKGKSCILEEENQLRALFKERKPIEAMAHSLGKSKGAIYTKLDELGLKLEVVETKKTQT
jgi:hypothetical protein